MQSACRMRSALLLTANASRLQTARTQAFSGVRQCRHMSTQDSGNHGDEKDLKKQAPGGILSRFFATPKGERNPLLAVLGYYSSESRAIGAGNELYKQALSRAEAVTKVETGGDRAFAPRYEMLSVHVYLILRRLRAEKGSEFEADVKTVMQCLFDVFWTDVRNRMIIKENNMKLIESGRLVKECEKQFFGMALAFDEAWGDEEKMKGAIRRNITCLKAKNSRVERFMGYMVRERRRLDNATLEQVWSGGCWDDEYPKVQSV